jgi:Ca2+-binding RTX toxin-like protein
MAIKVIRGTSNDDNLTGSETADKIFGYGGKDNLQGLAGDDLLSSGEGDDRLEGGEGNDRLNGGPGKDTLLGVLGDDFYILTLGDEVKENPNEGNDTIQADFSVFLPANFENIILTGGAALNALGNDSDNTITGNAGANKLSGGKGNDTLIGLDGSDALDGGSGRDIMIGGKGNDTYRVDNIGDKVMEEPNQGRDTVYASINYSLNSAPNVENLVLQGNAFDGQGNNANNELTGNTGTNTLRGGRGNDKLDGQGGNDSLFGDRGDDTLEGGDGNDNLDSGAGNDRLIGGPGNDILVGGPGADEFVYDAGVIFNTASVFGQDTITDFTVDTDLIVLDKTSFTVLKSSAGGTGLTVSSEFASVTSNGAVTNSSAPIVYNRQTGGLFYHPGGKGAASALFATLVGLPNLSASDFKVQS